MAKKKVQKKPVYPEEMRICGTIFVLQLVAVLSAVSIVYLVSSSCPTSSCPIQQYM